MSNLVVDTHAAIWHFANSDELSSVARTASIDCATSGETIFLATISLVEITYLIEKGRLSPRTLPSLIQALRSPDSGFAAIELTINIAQVLLQIPRGIVPDMPDRIIAATALALNLPLVTRDAAIRKLTNLQCVW